MESRIIIVSGGGSGIGAAISAAFLALGDTVVIAQRSKPNQNIVNASNADWIASDFSEPNTPTELIKAVKDKYGRIDVLVNNAGMMLQTSLEQLTLSEWQQVMQVNLTTPMLLSKFALPLLKQTGGSIINISSVEASAANPEHASYCASKAGLEGLTRAIAIDHGKDGIRCNAIAPGWIDTDLNIDFIESQPNPESFKKGLANIHPVGRTGSPEDIAAMAVWLASNQSGFVTGQVFTVDGGRTAKLSLP